MDGDTNTMNDGKSLGKSIDKNQYLTANPSTLGGPNVGQSVAVTEMQGVRGVVGKDQK